MLSMGRAAAHLRAEDKERVGLHDVFHHHARHLSQAEGGEEASENELPSRGTAACGTHVGCADGL